MLSIRSAFAKLKTLEPCRARSARPAGFVLGRRSLSQMDDDVGFDDNDFDEDDQVVRSNGSRKMWCGRGLKHGTEGAITLAGD